MDRQHLRADISKLISQDSEMVKKHLQILGQMVGIDSRSFGVNEFEGDRTTPIDMKEILECARDYLRGIGMPQVKINNSISSCPFPILMAETFVSEAKPTVLFYAHLDKQPYMDDEKFLKWGGISPTKLRWNEDRSRAYGRGAADDLSGVISIGMAIDAVFTHFGIQPGDGSNEKLSKLPCNIKIIYETEEESGSHSLINQIQENGEFFKDIDCVIITDVVNPAQGVPGLTTSLRGIVQLDVTLEKVQNDVAFDEQTALYKLLATLIDDDHTLQVHEIALADRKVTNAELEGYSRVPTSVAALRETAGLLPETLLTVSSDISSILMAQLRTSFANARPGHRVTGSVILGTAGARLTIPEVNDPKEFKDRLQKIVLDKNGYNLELKIETISDDPLSIDIILRSSEKDPHSGVNGGPVPIPELQLASIIDELISNDGSMCAPLEQLRLADARTVRVEALKVNQDLIGHPYEEKSARSWVEIRLAPGNDEFEGEKYLRSHLEKNVAEGFRLDMKADKGAAPWMTSIEHPVFSLILECLQSGFKKKACLYGCGGTIPFVAKLMQALGDGDPLCLGAYDPDSRMHEPGESLSMIDLLGCTRTIIHFLSRIDEAYGQKLS